jgi:hypothetical protein
LLSTGSLTFTADAAGAYYVVSAGASISSATSASGSFSSTQGISADQKKFTTKTASDTFTVVPTGAAGSTFTVTGYEDNANGVVTDVLTVTIAGTSVFGVVDPSKSTLSWVGTGTTTAEATSDVTDANQVKYTDANGLILNIQLNDAYGNNITSTTGALVATVTSGAVVGFGAISTCGTVVAPTVGTFTQSATATCPQSINLGIKQATVGAGWNGTVTVTYNGVTIGTKSGKITGAPASILAAPAKVVAVSSAATNVGWLYYVKDSAGNEIDATAGAVVLSSSSDTSVISNAVSATAPTPGAATSYGLGQATCLKAGSSKIVLQTTTNGVVTKSNEITQLCGGDAYSYAASFDKASYVPGDIATLTITATDSKGNPTNDYETIGTGTGALAPSIAGSNLTAVTAPTSADTFTGGKKTYKFIVGSTPGSYQLALDLPDLNNTTYSQSAITVAYKIATSTTAVSNEDVLKAIVSLIASINKQIAALQKALLRR